MNVWEFNQKEFYDKRNLKTKKIIEDLINNEGSKIKILGFLNNFQNKLLDINNSIKKRNQLFFDEKEIKILYEIKDLINNNSNLKEYEKFKKEFSKDGFQAFKVKYKDELKKIKIIFDKNEKYKSPVEGSTINQTIYIEFQLKKLKEMDSFKNFLNQICRNFVEEGFNEFFYNLRIYSNYSGKLHEKIIAYLKNLNFITCDNNKINNIGYFNFILGGFSIALGAGGIINLITTRLVFSFCGGVVGTAIGIMGLVRGLKTYTGLWTYEECYDIIIQSLYDSLVNQKEDIGKVFLKETNELIQQFIDKLIHSKALDDNLQKFFDLIKKVRMQNNFDSPKSAIELIQEDLENYESNKEVDAFKKYIMKLKK